MSNILTVEAAEAIIDAFGPCTSMYECISPTELVEQFNEFQQNNPEDTLNDFVAICLKVEGVQAERMDDTGACYREWKAVRSMVEDVLRRLGYEVKP
jgi:hypothetical protein